MKKPLQALTQKNCTLLIAAALATGLLAGCAGTPKSGVTAETLPAIQNASAEEVVGTRAQQRVDLLVASQFDKAYNYLLPSYRALNSAESYRTFFGGGAKWVAPKVSKVECTSQERCNVTVDLGVLVVAPGFGTKPIASTMFETWLKEDGQWWYYQRD